MAPRRERPTRSGETLWVFVGWVERSEPHHLLSSAHSLRPARGRPSEPAASPIFHNRGRCLSDPI